jgi:branched-chain amino acid transport system ATP-binding protein
MRPKAGTLLYRNYPLNQLPPHKIVALGISHCPEGRHLFGRLTVAENLQLGAVQRRDVENVQRDIEHIFKLFPVLKDRNAQLAGTLSGGEQQMLAIGRALMSHPQLLLLDEPSLGLAPILVSIIFDTIRQLKREGTTILLVEQNARLALDIADRAYVLETGRVTLQGPAKELKHNPQVEHTYLGT